MLQDFGPQSQKVSRIPAYSVYIVTSMALFHALVTASELILAELHAIEWKAF